MASQTRVKLLSFLAESAKNSMKTCVYFSDVVRTVSKEIDSSLRFKDRVQDLALRAENILREIEHMWLSEHIFT